MRTVRRVFYAVRAQSQFGTTLWERRDQRMARELAKSESRLQRVVLVRVEEYDDQSFHEEVLDTYERAT